MKLFCAVLVIYVVALMLFGAEGRGSGSTNGVEDPKLTGLFQRAGRHARDLNNELSMVANEEPPPPPKHFRSRRAVANEEPPPPKEFRQRRQAPPGLPPPPEGMPAPPQM
ncbi:actin cytoskeleton-regulatory complex protein pan1 isoform X1 [Drosophila miranda]|uniref:actin cytoskeleton-regulatory complex protein pan1 isoform X1 n=1 Tax=Drosophila miranda TaxID=7229 RepID=UPI0007E5F4DC|nr:actin cytoskeleton-regulatory complex protein pan1 isoform X1 [Drosophila miranda]